MRRMRLEQHGRKLRSWRGRRASRSGKSPTLVAKVVPFPLRLALLVHRTDHFSLLHSGIDEMFLYLTKQLIARGDRLERERLRKERESVMLHDPDPNTNDDEDDFKFKKKKFAECCSV